MRRARRTRKKRPPWSLPLRRRRRERRCGRAADVDAASRHLPHPAAIDSYGNGGFRFGGMSHRGSLLCLPGGVWASGITTPAEIDVAALAPALAPDAAIDHFI